MEQEKEQYTEVFNRWIEHHQEMMNVLTTYHKCIDSNDMDGMIALKQTLNSDFSIPVQRQWDSYRFGNLIKDTTQYKKRLKVSHEHHIRTQPDIKTQPVYINATGCTITEEEEKSRRIAAEECRRIEEERHRIAAEFARQQAEEEEENRRNRRNLARIEEERHRIAVEQVEEKEKSRRIRIEANETLAREQAEAKEKSRRIAAEESCSLSQDLPATLHSDIITNQQDANDPPCLTE